MSLVHGVYQSPLGRVVVVATDAGLRGVYFSGQKYFPERAALGELAPEHPHVAAALEQLAEYFGGKRRAFDLTLAPEGGAFAQSVWRELARIAPGTTSTYGALARRLGKPKAARAVGAATGRNPLSIVVPCHRLVGATGKLTGYAGGLDRKERLLALENGAV
jgi:methylated-DNA-[protein]-cysteine S-methyltransferase